jgi:cell division protein FtsQ
VEPTSRPAGGRDRWRHDIRGGAAVGRSGFRDGELTCVATRRRGQQQITPAGAAVVRGVLVSVPLRSTVARLVPSLRSLVGGLVLLALGAGAYVFARDTSTFAVRRIEVEGATPALAAQVEEALRPVLGTSLVALDRAGVERRADALPWVVRASYDRAFPHTLRVRVVQERAVAVLRVGKTAWLVSARGRLIVPVVPTDRPSLPRLWEPAALRPVSGDFLAGPSGGTAARSLGLAARFPAGIRTASLSDGQLVFRLRSGLELRLGDPTDIRLKLAIASRALPLLPVGATYLDVSLPGRPVTGDQNTQVSGRG